MCKTADRDVTNPRSAEGAHGIHIYVHTLLRGQLDECFLDKAGHMDERKIEEEV